MKKKKETKAESKPRQEDLAELNDKKTITDAGRIIASLKGRKPGLDRLDELAATEPPFPTYGGMALEEDLKKRKRLGQPSPYLP